MFNDEKFIQEFTEIAKELKVKTALETGHGSGELVAALREVGIDAFGIDKSPDLLRVPNAPHFHTAALEEFFSKKKYDLVYSSGVLEHFEDNGDVDFIKKMASLSKKYVLNFVPNSNCEAYRAAKLRSNAAWKDEADYNEEYLRVIHEAAGLTVVKTGAAGQEWAKRFGPEPSEPYLVYALAKKSNRA